MYEEYVAAGDETHAKAFLIERCRWDVETFAYAFFPHFCEFPFNRFHKACFEDWRADVRRTRYADAAHRGSAKSTLKVLIKPIHDLCYALENFIVIISETSGQAAGKLKDIRSELIENKRLISHFGPFFRSKVVAETGFVANAGKHKTMFQGYGSGAEVRGIRFGAHRPSKIILDDAEHSDEVHNEELRAKKEDWFKQEISKLGNMRTNIEVVGTILHKQSLLANLGKNPAYRYRMYKAIISWSERGDLWQQWREIYGNLDDDQRVIKAQAFYDVHETELLRGTEVLWPEHYTYLDLMKEMYEIGRKAFMKEMQNEPIPSDQALFDTMHWYTETGDGFLIEKSGVLVPWKDLSPVPLGVIDPATGQTKPKVGKLGDFTCILIGYADKRGRVFVSTDWTKRAAPTKYIAAIFDLWDLYKFERFGVEVNLYRNLLLPNIVTEKERRERERKAAGMKDHQYLLKFYDIEQTENKTKRIYTLEPKVENGYILFNKTLSDEFRNQMEAFPLGEHDDAPDALEMLWSLANGRFTMSSLSLQTHKGR